MDIVARIDEWSYRRPDRPAHISGERSLSYLELNLRSDALAAHLSSLHLQERSPIAVLGHKEPEMLIAFLGCIKVFFFNDTATTEIYTLSLHDALPIYQDQTTRQSICS